MRYSFVFVCQQGSLEVKSMLLAASLKRQVGCDHELVAALPVPRERWGQPAASTLAFLERLGTRLVPITNGIDLDYPIGNKVSCLGIATDADVRIFLDSDILCLQPFCGLGAPGVSEMPAQFCAVPADMDQFGASDAIWALIYGSQNLTLPAERMRATVSGQMMLPYFNAGFIAVDSRIDFAATWLRICREIDGDPRIINKRPWLDQIALPVAVKYLGIDYAALDERYNHPAHLKPVGPDPLPYFVHYHNQKLLFASPMLRNLAFDLAAEHPLLKEAIGKDPKWRRLTHASPAAIFERSIKWLRRVF
jgi:hypothetical protein